VVGLFGYLCVWDVCFSSGKDLTSDLLGRAFGKRLPRESLFGWQFVGAFLSSPAQWAPMLGFYSQKLVNSEQENVITTASNSE
jgi:hypothetical protein